MKKKLFLSITSAFCALACVAGFAACDDHQHNYRSTTVDPTCTEGGYTTYICECGDEYVSNQVPAAGHSFDDYTLSGDGTKSALCSVTGCHATDTVTVTGENGASFRSFRVNGVKVNGGKHAHAIATFDFEQEVVLHGDASYFVTTDKTAKAPLPTKTVSLAEGQNTYYIVVTSGAQELIVYEVSLYRNHMYTVSFEGLSATRQVEEGQVVSVPTEIPTKTGHGFGGWYFNFSEKIWQDTQISAIWVANTHTISVMAEEGGTVQGAGAYKYGAQATLKATTNSGYTFLGWYNGTQELSRNTSYTFTVTGNATITAKWQRVESAHTITVSAEEGGTASANKTSVLYGESVTLTAVASSGYVFEGWYENGQKISGAGATYTIASVTKDIAYTAKFTRNTCTLTVNATTGGTVEGGGTYNVGTQVSLTATALAGYRFTGWSDGETSASRTITLTTSQTLTANFVKTYEVTVAKNIAEAGTVEGVGVYDSGAQVTLKAMTNEGYTFLGWHNGTQELSRNTSYTFTVTGDTTITAEWQVKAVASYTITVEHSITDAGNTTGAGTYTSGAQATMVATPNTGYTFLGWYNGTQELSRNTSYTFTVTGDTTITAKWKKNTYAITVNKTAGGSVAGTGVYEYGAQATLTATNNDGYKFLGWYDENDNLIESAPSYSFKVVNARTLTAKWKQEAQATDEDTWRSKQGYNYFYYEQLGADVMPIGSWYSPPPATSIKVYDYQTNSYTRETFSTDQITLENYQTLAGSGINAAYGLIDTSKSQVTKALEYADQVGIVYLVRDYNALSDFASGDETTLDARYYASAPAFGGTLFGDEPGYLEFEQIGKATENWRANETYGESRLSLVNNLPIYSTAAQLYYDASSEETKVPYDYKTNFKEWVQAYIDIVDPQVYSYDFYPFNGTTTAVRADYYKNMSIVREVCQEANIPFWTFAQVGAWDGPRELSQAEIAIQINTSLAYGAKGVQWFTYWQPLEFDGDYICGLVDKMGNKTKYYDMVKKVNAQIAAVDSVLMKSASKGIVQIGKSKLGAIPADDIVSEYGAMTSATGAGNAIVGCFEYRDEGYAYYVSSNDTKAGACVTLNLDGVYDVKKIQNATETSATTNSVTVSVEAGEGALVVVPKTKSSKSVATITVQNGDETYGATLGSGSYGIGTQATIVAQPISGYLFEGWYDGATKVSEDAVYTFTVSGNKTLKGQWKVDTTPVMLNNCELVQGWMQAAATPTLSTSNVFEGSHSLEVSSATDWWWVNVRVQDASTTLAKLQAKYETITLNIYSSYPDANGQPANTLYLGNGAKVAAILANGDNVVTINTADLTSGMYVTDATGSYLSFFVGGKSTLRFDNVVATRKAGYIDKEILLNDCEVVGNGAFEVAGATVEVSSEHVVQGASSVKMTTTQGLAPTLIYLINDGLPLTREDILGIDYIEMTIYADISTGFYFYNHSMGTLEGGKSNVVRISGADFLAQIDGGNKGSTFDPYHYSLGYAYFQVASSGVTLYFDNIIAVKK